MREIVKLSRTGCPFSSSDEDNADYSALRASTGFTAAAREAGRKLADAAAAARMRGTVAQLNGSKGLTPNNGALIKRETASAAPRPTAMPIPVRARAERTNTPSVRP